MTRYEVQTRVDAGWVNDGCGSGDPEDALYVVREAAEDRLSRLMAVGEPEGSYRVVAVLEGRLS